MAEFSELVQIKKRMCNKFGRNTCKGCPLLHQGCGIIAILGHSDYEFKELEDTLLSWSAEHPALVYPTWGEWLEQQGIAKLINSDRYEGDGQKVYVLLESVENQIPADMAQRLDIEPKK